MAIAIKSIPVLKGKVAEEFDRKALKNFTKKKHTIDFTKQADIAAKILAKAKL
ncbi:MAG TPA: hypothetical protein VL053_17195 [Arachidicoccus sp.]|nr:hypothetical protein [Arachidicoccus sp.]